MLVYRKQTRRTESVRALSELRGEEARDVLIGLGEIEAGIADALCPEEDRPSEVARGLRSAMLLAARGLPGDALDRALSLPLPATVELSVPEGYAYYSLYPEMYREAARRFFAECHPERAAVIGIRSIGTSLSAAVAATLDELGCGTVSWTVRPRGHPFERRLALSPEFETELRAHAGAYFLVVDEGPGLSGSSMTSVAEKLSALGAADGRIVLFPSWTPDGAAFVSGAARDRWRRHRKYAVSFEELWPGYSGLEDLSAGRWRRLFWTGEAAWPAAQPQHERRKYRVRDGALLKFAGLGRYGARRLERARQLAEAGFTPPVRGLEDGFLAGEFVAGRPLSGQDAGPELLEFVARYLAWLRRHCPADRGAGFDELLELIRINAGEKHAENVRGFRAAVTEAPAVAIDGRLLPHEFVATPAGYLKTDALDHHDDHFYPGCQDIAWDLAGACVELGLDPEALLARYQSLSGDRGIAHRLPFYRAAYVAFRLGYAILAQTAIAGSPDAARFAEQARRYAALLG